MKYAVLLYPHPNKRYYEAMKPLCINELSIITQHFNKKLTNIQYGEIGGLELLTFEADALEDVDIKTLSYLSSYMAIFEVKDDIYLRPIVGEKKYYLKSDMSSILKYKGKTNEVFTDMMINVGVFSSDFYNEFDKPLNILDPMCGKGTTLYQGLIKGYNVSGIEIDKKDVEEAAVFLKKYFEFHHYKHNTENASVTAQGKKLGSKFIFNTADTAENFKKKDFRTLQISSGNTMDIGAIYPKKEAFHSIITDLPYGVQHAGLSGSQVTSLDKLLQSVVPRWLNTLKKGGTIVLAYNTYTLKRTVLEKIFIDNGMTVLNEFPYDKFEHWVEQAVNRDIVVAKK